MPADMEEGRERPPCLRAVFSLEGGEHGKEKKSCSAKVATREGTEVVIKCGGLWLGRVRGQRSGEMEM